MIEFREFLREMAAMTNQFDMDFMKRAEIVSSLNVTGTDLGTTKYKAEIQYLIKKHFFPDFDLSETAPSFNESQVNTAIAKLKSLNASRFKSLMSWTPKGVGPGEVLLYFIIDDCALGGGSSAGVDITSGNTGYEVKAADLNVKEGFFYQFRIGGTANISAPLKAAGEIKKELGLRGRETEIAKGQIAEIKAGPLGGRWIEEVEQPYKKAAYDYFKGHDTIFIINKVPSRMQGQCFQKTITLADIELDAVTGGTIKPKIRR